MTGGERPQLQDVSLALGELEPTRRCCNYQRSRLSRFAGEY